MQLELTLAGLWVLLSQKLGPDEPSLDSSHMILPMTGRVGDRGPEGEPLVSIPTACSDLLCSLSWGEN